ncbi:MAG: HAMP domain-containing histidine kinase [Lachnospiraceae bacterium]|nr:HAMP domain-containing histidine kinase [Lachnospiraceae bacterium]
MKKLQRKMIAVAFVSIILVFSILVAGMYFTLVLSNANRADAITRLISYNNGRMPVIGDFNEEEFEARTRYKIDLNEEAEFRTRYFTVTVTAEADNYDIKMDHIASVSQTDAVEMAKNVLNKKRETGYYGRYRYRIASTDSSEEYVIFLDCSDYFDSQKASLNISIVLSVMFALLISFIFASLSSKILKPFERNQKAQKQFITDASHELKTPLAIISANAEVLKYKYGENEWTDNIVQQTGKMSSLINQLLILSRMEEFSDNDKKEMLDYSSIVSGSLNRFSEMINERNVTVKNGIDKDIMITGVRNQIENLADILIENAAKYVTEDGDISIKLNRSGRKTVLRIYNSADIQEDIDPERIFDRFYRTDESRNSTTGGHGIGLSIAKRITEEHGGKIEAELKENGIEFIVTI